MLRAALGIFAVLWLAFAPCVPAQNQITYIGVVSAAAGCASSPDFGDVVFAVNYKNETTCTGTLPAERSYTMEVDTGDYPDGLAFATAEDNCNEGTPYFDDMGLFTAPTVDNLDGECVPYVTTQDNTPGRDTPCHLNGPVNDTHQNYRNPGPDGQVMLGFLHRYSDTPRYNTDATWYWAMGTTNWLVGLQRDAGNVNDLNIPYKLGSTSIAYLSSGNDTTSDCCDGVACDNILMGNGVTGDNKVIYITMAWQTTGGSGTDFINMYVNFADGTSDSDPGGGTDYTARCLVDSVTGVDLNANFENPWTSSRGSEIRVGNVDFDEMATWWAGFDNIMSRDNSIDLYNLMSGGDGLLTDSDQCWCGDVDTGTDCGAATVCTPPSDIALIWNGEGCVNTPCFTGTYLYDDVDEYPLDQVGVFSGPDTNHLKVVSGGDIGTGNSMWLSDNRASGTYFSVVEDLIDDGIFATNEDVCIFMVVYVDDASENIGTYVTAREDTDDWKMRLEDDETRMMDDVERLLGGLLQQEAFSLAWFTDAMQTDPDTGYTKPGSDTEYWLQHWVNGSTPTAYFLNDSRSHQMTTAAELIIGAFAENIGTGTAPGYIDSIFIVQGDTALCRCGDTSECGAGATIANSLSSSDTLHNQVFTLGNDLCSEW